MCKDESLKYLIFKNFLCKEDYIFHVEVTLGYLMK